MVNENFLNKEMKARVSGVHAQMKMFKLYFGSLLGGLILQQPEDFFLLLSDSSLQKFR